MDEEVSAAGRQGEAGVPGVPGGAGGTSRQEVRSQKELDVAMASGRRPEVVRGEAIGKRQPDTC